MRKKKDQATAGLLGVFLGCRHTLAFNDQHDGGIMAMQTEMVDKSEKKVYATPQLIVHGTMEEITAQQNKVLGPTDGFLFNQTPIMNS